MTNIRILDIDNELLSQLILNNFNIDQFLFLRKLIVRQVKNSWNHELLTTINRLGRSSSLSSIQLQQYRTNVNLTIDDLYLLLHDISHHFYRLTLYGRLPEDNKQKVFFLYIVCCLVMGINFSPPNFLKMPYPPTAKLLPFGNIRP